MFFKEFPNLSNEHPYQGVQIKNYSIRKNKKRFFKGICSVQWSLYIHIYRLVLFWCSRSGCSEAIQIYRQYNWIIGFVENRNQENIGAGGKYNKAILSQNNRIWLEIWVLQGTPMIILITEFTKRFHFSSREIKGKGKEAPLYEIINFSFHHSLLTPMIN